jgi:hypothetical protein
MIITDIDSTVLEHLSSTPIKKTIDYINSLNTKVIVISGRPRSMRAETERALKNAGLKYSSLLLNPYDYRLTNKWKAECANKLNDATLAIDDNAGARKAYEAEGIRTMHPDDVPDVEKFWAVFESNSGY